MKEIIGLEFTLIRTLANMGFSYKVIAYHVYGRPHCWSKSIVARVGRVARYLGAGVTKYRNGETALARWQIQRAKTRTSRKEG